MSIKDAAEALAGALRAVPGLRVYTDLGATIDPPGAIVGPPILTWDVPGDPTNARFLIYVVAAADEYAVEKLWDLVPQVAGALDLVTDAAVTRADPGLYPSGGVELPCYEITCEVAL